VGERDETIRFYDATARRSFDEWFDNDALLPTLRDFVSLLPPRPRILDLGCGTGGESKRLLGLGAEVVGIDLSRESLKLARANVGGATFLEMDIADLEFPPKSFDGAMEAGVLFHFDASEQEGILARIHGILRDGGVFLSYYPEGSFEGLERFTVEGREFRRYARKMPQGEWVAAVEAAGFAEIKRLEFLVGSFRCVEFAKR